MASDESLLKIGSVPDPLLHLLSSEQVLSLLDQLVSSHLHILVEQVATEDLLPVLVVKGVGGQEEHAQGGLGHELQILVMEEGIVVVEEEELNISSLVLK